MYSKTAVEPFIAYRSAFAFLMHTLMNFFYFWNEKICTPAHDTFHDAEPFLFDQRLPSQHCTINHHPLPV
jgi:hypothetical protein